MYNHGHVGPVTLNFWFILVVPKTCGKKTISDRLHAAISLELEPGNTTATLADSSGLPVYGSINLQGRIRKLLFGMEFLFSRISDDAILGMPYLKGQKYMLSLDKGVWS